MGVVQGQLPRILHAFWRVPIQIDSRESRRSSRYKIERDANAHNQRSPISHTEKLVNRKNVRSCYQFVLYILRTSYVRCGWKGPLKKILLTSDAFRALIGRCKRRVRTRFLSIFFYEQCAPRECEKRTSQRRSRRIIVFVKAPNIRIRRYLRHVQRQTWFRKREEATSPSDW